MLIHLPGRAVQWARVFIHPALKQGATAVDATAGNGHDTLFLAGSVGPGGRVYAIDIQEEAIGNIKKRLEAAGLGDRVTLIRGGHQEMDRLVGTTVDAVMFNLGYLPGSDQSVTTGPDTTREGIKAALRIINPGGRISVVVYTGHRGSRAEAGEVANLLACLDPKYYSVQKMLFWNSRGHSPELYFVTRTGNEK